MQNMTVSQLARAVDQNERIYISSLYDISHDVELTTELRAYTGILNLEVLTLTHHEEGYTAVVDLPAAVMEALKPE